MAPKAGGFPSDQAPRLVGSGSLANVSYLCMYVPMKQRMGVPVVVCVKCRRRCRCNMFGVNVVHLVLFFGSSLTWTVRVGNDPESRTGHAESLGVLPLGRNASDQRVIQSSANVFLARSWCTPTVANMYRYDVTCQYSENSSLFVCMCVASFCLRL